MSTGYVAEVDTVNGTRYVGKQGKLSKVPVFWQTAAALKRAMKPRYSWRDRYDQKRDGEKTQIVICKNLEAGLRASSASRHSVYEFMQMSGPTAKAPRYGKDKVFKIEFAGQGAGVNRKRFVGDGRFGKTWESAGALRLHITANIERLAGMYKGANVVVITTDGLTVSNATYVPIVDFYRMSPDSNKQFMNRYGSMLSSFVANEKTSEYV